MHISDLQKFLTRVQTRLDAKFGKNESKELTVLSSMVKVTEETWELAEQIMLWRGRQRDEKWTFDMSAMEAEIADVVLATSLLADQLWIDLESALQTKMDHIKSKRS